LQKKNKIWLASKNRKNAVTLVYELEII